MIAFQNRLSQYQMRESNRQQRTDPAAKKNPALSARKQAAREECYRKIVEIIRTSTEPVTSQIVADKLGINRNTVSEWLNTYPNEVPCTRGPRLGTGKSSFYQLVLKGAK